MKEGTPFDPNKKTNDKRFGPRPADENDRKSQAKQGKYPHKNLSPERRAEIQKKRAKTRKQRQDELRKYDPGF